MVFVILRNLSATKTLELNLQEDCQLSSLKRLVESSWGVPCDCQRVNLGTNVLTDSEFVTCLHAGCVSPLHLTVVVSLDTVLSQAVTPEARYAALRAIHAPF